MSWNYADLSKAAKKAGGPEKYVERLAEASKREGKIEMLPWVGVAAVGASLFTVATQKIINYFKEKRRNNHDDIEIANKKLIDGIKEYDTSHENKDERDKK